MDERFLVTGSGGCIGAWVVAQLVGEGVGVVCFDASDDDHRLALLLDDEQRAGLPVVRGDITDAGQVERALDAHGITHVIHLAALQVPFCRADPSLGARVNVVGTVHVLDAVARRADRMGPLVYASSVAAYDALEEGGETAASMDGSPGTLYGVFKRANEGSARVYAAERGLASVGLRPHTVYGPGRDQGLTSAPTTAMLAAAAGSGFHVPFGGRCQMQYAPDVAAAFVAAARAPAEGAQVRDVGGAAVGMDEVVAAIEAAAPEVVGRVTVEPVELPFPAEGADAVVPPDTTSLADGVADTVARFRDLLARGLVTPP